MPNEYLEKTYLLGADLIEKTGMNNGYNGVFSASMIGKTSKILWKSRIFYNVAQKRGVPFYIMAVLNPKIYIKEFFQKFIKII